MFEVGKKYRGEKSGTVYTCVYVGKTISMLTFPNGGDSVCYNSTFDIFTEVKTEPTTWIPEVGKTYLNGRQQEMLCCYTDKEKDISVFIRKRTDNYNGLKYDSFTFKYGLPIIPSTPALVQPRNTVLDPVYSEEDFDWISAGTDIL